MKKYLLYSLLGVAALSATSCNEDFNEDVAAPQQWEQEAAITLPGFSVSATSAIDFANVTDSVTIFSFSRHFKAIIGDSSTFRHCYI